MKKLNVRKYSVAKRAEKSDNKFRSQKVNRIQSFSTGRCTKGEGVKPPPIDPLPWAKK